ncbi:MAG: winged helix-turn-helix transcriptional regulator [Myxococcales bacterium]|nr:winged helix-turn-helix transcriptional regulator [Myxococcales bacterium]
MRKAHDRATPLETIRQGLVELRRLFQRRELVEQWSAAFGARARLDYGELRLLDAIRVAEARAPATGATVGDAARLLGIDPSRASRQVAAAVARGLVTRAAAPGDGRRVVLVVTPRGSRLQAQGGELTRARIALALATWPPAEQARFAALFERFVAGMLPPPPRAARAGRRRAAAQNSRPTRRPLV